MYGAEMWSLDDEWKETENTWVIFSKKTLHVASFAAKEYTELEMETSIVKQYLAMKHWLRISHMTRGSGKN
jgi:hypothetical protein